MQYVHRARSRSIPRIVAMLAMAGALASSLAACGYKGPLYMPGSPQDHPRRVPPPAVKPGEPMPDSTTPSASTPNAATPAAQPAAPDDANRRSPVPNLFQ